MSMHECSLLCDPIDSNVFVRFSFVLVSLNNCSSFEAALLCSGLSLKMLTTLFYFSSLRLFIDWLTLKMGLFNWLQYWDWRQLLSITSLNSSASLLYSFSCDQFSSSTLTLGDFLSFLAMLDPQNKLDCAFGESSTSSAFDEVLGEGGGDALLSADRTGFCQSTQWNSEFCLTVQKLNLICCFELFGVYNSKVCFLSQIFEGILELQLETISLEVIMDWIVRALSRNQMLKELSIQYLAETYLQFTDQLYSKHQFYY